MTYRLRDLIDWDETRFQAVREHVDRAAAAIIPTDPVSWAGWVVYLLECLDMHGDAERVGYDFEGTLLGVRAAIDGRLDEGRW